MLPVKYLPPPARFSAKKDCYLSIYGRYGTVIDPDNYLKNNPDELLHTDPCAPAGGLAVADQSKTQSQPCSAFAGTPESSPYPCGKLAGTPETFPHPCGSFAGTPDCFLHPCGNLAGTPETLPHPCSGFAGKTN
ncbi:hypothetical protein [Rurimicrobium arvi]|uniref:hypothetical protein n=1 Tax=Rurimicrobium arvi TaxID=2049916 RepID=UPI0031E1B183